MARRARLRRPADDIQVDPGGLRRALRRLVLRDRQLHDAGAVEQAVDRLREQGHVFDHDGAVWLRTTDFGDDKDRVLIRANGEPTYFAADAAYYLSKKDRGFDEKIYLLGADHHGYINRLKAIAACAGDDPEHNIEVLIGQLVNLNGAKLSKRAGNIIELRDLIELDRHRRDPLLPGPLPGRQPAVAGRRGAAQADQRQPGLLRAVRPRPDLQRRPAGAARTACGREDGFDPSLLADPTEAALLAVLGDFPRVVAQAAHLREPHRVARYLEDLAGALPQVVRHLPRAAR